MFASAVGAFLELIKPGSEIRRYEFALSTLEVILFLPFYSYSHYNLPLKIYKL
jgi:hypothetical protein